MDQIAPTLIATRGDGGATQMDRRSLEFRDSELEAEFRATYRSRNLGQARFALVFAAILTAVFTAADFFNFPRPDWLTIGLLGGPLMALLLVLAGLTYTAFYRTRWPMLLVIAEQAFALSFVAMFLAVKPPILYAAGFNMVVIGCYVLMPLIYKYGRGAALSMTALYFVPLAVFGLGHLGLRDLAILALQFAAANAIGMFALYRSERFRRLDFLAARRIDDERGRYRDLLTSILPVPVADQLQQGRQVADSFDDASVLFADIAGFTALTARHSAEVVVELLNRLFDAFDELVARHGLEKIKTIGDSYMVAGGVPQPNPAHLTAIARLALDMRDAAAAMAAPDGAPLQLHIGLHAGPVRAGVIGRSRFLYDLWGDTVNVASRMERLGAPGAIQVTDEVRQRLGNGFCFEPRGEIEVKGRGRMRTWYLTGTADG